MIKIFNYISELDCFLINPDYKKITEKLNLSEVAWIGRHFLLESSASENWMSKNADEKLAKKAVKLGLKTKELLVISAELFEREKDASFNNILERKGFWTDVLSSLELSADTIFNEAIRVNSQRRKKDEKYLQDIEQRVEEIRYVLISNEKS